MQTRCNERSDADWVRSWADRCRTICRALVLAVALLAGWFAATATSAGTIGIRGNTLVIGAEASDGDVILLGSVSPTDFVLDIAGAVFDLVTPGCSVSPTGFTCPLSGFSLLEVIGGSGNDVLDFTSVTLSVTLAGGAGDDILFAGAGGGALYGGSGDDVLLDSAGASLLFGGPGDDTVLGGVDLGDDDPVFTPLPRRSVPVPAPGSLLLLLSGLGAAAMVRRAGSYACAARRSAWIVPTGVASLGPWSVPRDATPAHARKQGL